MKGRARCLMILAIIMSLFVFSGQALAEKTLKVGIMGPFTGPSAKAGNEFKTSVQMVMEKIGGKIATVLPDRAERYFSTALM